MKKITFLAFAFTLLLGGNALADHNHHYDYNDFEYAHAHDRYNHHGHSNYHGHNTHSHAHHNYQAPARGREVRSTATYYTRSYPVSKTYTYQTTPNTTIHHPPYATSTCAHRCEPTTKRVTVSRQTGGRTYTYRAPSEHSGQERRIITPRKRTHTCTDNLAKHRQTYVSPYQTHKLSTTTCTHCHY